MNTIMVYAVEWQQEDEWIPDGESFLHFDDAVEHIKAEITEGGECDFVWWSGNWEEREHSQVRPYVLDGEERWLRIVETEMAVPHHWN